MGFTGKRSVAENSLGRLVHLNIFFFSASSHKNYSLLLDQKLKNLPMFSKCPLFSGSILSITNLKRHIYGDMNKRVILPIHPFFNSSRTFYCEIIMSLGELQILFAPVSNLKIVIRFFISSSLDIPGQEFKTINHYRILMGILVFIVSLQYPLRQPFVYVGGRPAIFVLAVFELRNLGF